MSSPISENPLPRPENLMENLERKTKDEKDFNDPNEPTFSVDKICEVWQSNLYTEIRNMMALDEKYKFVALDTEYPGWLSKSSMLDSSFYVYKALRENVGKLRLIQFGLTFFDSEGNIPEGISTWQFNFKFSLKSDLHSEESIEILSHSGINFEKMAKDGIDHDNFSELFISSGLVLGAKKIIWLSFHGCYDFAYLLSMMRGTTLPEKEEDFFSLLRFYFPKFYDLKYLMQINNMPGGLQRLGDAFKIDRIGQQHQAGSDSILTGRAFFKLIDYLKSFKIDYMDHLGHFYQLDANYETAKELDTTIDSE